MSVELVVFMVIIYPSYIVSVSYLFIYLFIYFLD